MYLHSKEGVSMSVWVELKWWFKKKIKVGVSLSCLSLMLFPCIVSALVFHFPAGRNQHASLTQLRHIKGLFFHRGGDSSAVSSKRTRESANHSLPWAETMVPNKRITWREETVVQSGMLMKGRWRLSQSGLLGARVALQLLPELTPEVAKARNDDSLCEQTLICTEHPWCRDRINWVSLPFLLF